MSALHLWLKRKPKPTLYNQVLPEAQYSEQASGFLSQLRTIPIGQRQKRRRRTTDENSHPKLQTAYIFTKLLGHCCVWYWRKSDVFLDMQSQYCARVGRRFLFVRFYLFVWSEAWRHRATPRVRQPITRRPPQTINPLRKQISYLGSSVFSRR